MNKVDNTPKIYIFRNCMYVTDQGYVEYKSTEYKLRQVLCDVRAGNSDLARSFSEKSNHAMYQDENSYRGLPSSQNYQN